MKKYELIAKLEVNPRKSLKLIEEFLEKFDNWDKYKDEYIGDKKIEFLSEESWNEKYLSEHIAVLNSNFSKERLEHIKEVIEYLYPEEEIEEESIFDKKKMLLITLVILLIGVSLMWKRAKSYFQQLYQEQMKEVVRDINGTKEKNQTKVIEQNSTKEMRISKERGI